ncbi:MAG: hypothetical protein ACE5GQ_08015 [Nitrospinales bacterium]
MIRKHKTPLISGLLLSLLALWIGTLSAEEKTPPASSSPRKIVKGFDGKAKRLARQWMLKDNTFTSIEFIPGNGGQFWDVGLLEGKLRSGKQVSIEIPEDFNGRNPGMIFDHLNALKFKAVASSFTRGEWKEQVTRAEKLRQKRERKQREMEEEIQRKIDARLKKILREESNSAAKSILAKVRKRIKKEERGKLVKQIEAEAKQAFPEASWQKLQLETIRKMNEELEARLNDIVEERLVAEQFESALFSDETGHRAVRIIERDKARVAAEVNAEYALKRKKALERLRLKKIDREKPTEAGENK